MDPTGSTTAHGRRAALADALAADDSSRRLQAALAAGSSPDPALLDVLVERCAVEPDFFVRDMLSWALTRLPPDAVLARIQTELGSPRAQARSQALHTMSKVGDGRAYAWTTGAVQDPDDEVARTAWRAAVALVPAGGEAELADRLVTQLGRGGSDVRRSLSRALVDLGEVVQPALQRAAAGPDPALAAHARATELLRRDPEAGFEAAVEEARRLTALGPDVIAATEAPAGQQTPPC